jgi:acyl-CoA dehydrogenase
MCMDFLLSVGELFTIVAYGQLIIEKSKMENIKDHIIDQIFDFMVRDFSKFALQLYSKTSSTQQQMDLCLKMIRKPFVNPEHFEKVWQNYVYVLKDTYEMTP